MVGLDRVAELYRARAYLFHGLRASRCQPRRRWMVQAFERWFKRPNFCSCSSFAHGAMSGRRAWESGGSDLSSVRTSDGKRRRTWEDSDEDDDAASDSGSDGLADVPQLVDESDSEAERDLPGEEFIN